MILLFGNSDGYILLPEVVHTYPPAKTYKAQRSIVVDEKDPSDVADYTVDWSQLLGSDTISVSLWSVPTGLTGISATKTTTTTNIWVSGGDENTDYYIGHRITTADGRKFDRYVVVPVRNL